MNFGLFSKVFRTIFDHTGGGGVLYGPLSQNDTGGGVKNQSKSVTYYLKGSLGRLYCRLKILQERDAIYRRPIGNIFYICINIKFQLKIIMSFNIKNIFFPVNIVFEQLPLVNNGHYFWVPRMFFLI